MELKDMSNEELLKATITSYDICPCGWMPNDYYKELLSRLEEGNTATEIMLVYCDPTEMTDNESDFFIRLHRERYSENYPKRGGKNEKKNNDK